MQIFKFYSASNLSSEQRACPAFQRLPKKIKHDCLFAILDDAQSSHDSLSSNDKHQSNLKPGLSSSEPATRFLAIFAEQLEPLDQSIFEQPAYLIGDDSSALELVYIECVLVDSQHSDANQVCLAGTMRSGRSKCSHQLSALVHSWIHAQNNLMSTISGYSELLAMDSNEPMLEDILSRSKQVALFNEKNAAFTLEAGRLIDSDLDKRERILNDASKTLEHYFEFEDLSSCQREELRLDSINRVIYRWTVSENFSIEHWDIASIYQAIGHQCHYLLKFELMRLSYYLGQFGAVIQTIKNPHNKQSLIEIVMPILSRDLSVPNNRLVIIPLCDDRKRNKAVTELVQLFGSLGIMCQAIPQKILNRERKSTAFSDCEVLQEASINEYIRIVKSFG
jgi:hypothetical protein